MFLSEKVFKNCYFSWFLVSLGGPFFLGQFFFFFLGGGGGGFGLTLVEIDL